MKKFITGKYRFYGSDCDALMTATLTPPTKTMKLVPCLICGEELSVELHEPHAKICEKCKEAVMKVRERMDWDPCTPILD